jgi:selenocysteine lyase/cysteine desulfurase
MATIDVSRARADTPGCQTHVHLNNAGASLMPRPVLDAVREHLELEAAQGGYEAEAARIDGIREAYRQVETLIGADEGTVAFTENATFAFAQALSAIPFREGDLILTTRNDYVSNQIMYLSLQERFGIRVERAPDHRPDEGGGGRHGAGHGEGGGEGGVDAGAMAELIHRRRPRLVAMSHVPTSSGIVQDAASVGRACREKGVPFLLDACQSVGQMPVDVRELECTFLAATSRKFLRGPRGAGFLYVSPGALAEGLTPLLPDMRGSDWIEEDLYQPGPDARRFEYWEKAWSLVLGTGAAARYATDLGLDAIQERSWALAGGLRELLSQVEGVQVMDRGRRLCGIVTVTAEGWVPTKLVRALRTRGIHTSSVGRGSAVLDLDDKGVEAVLRLSPHYYNTETELEETARVVDELVRAGP